MPNHDEAMQAIIDLHFMDCEMAGDVVYACLTELQRNLQRGQLDIVTGRGNHSHNKRSNLRPEIEEVVRSLGLRSGSPQGNQGNVRVEVKP